MTKENYHKPFLTFPRQIDKLRDRGLSVPSQQEALHLLGHVNYPRLQGYWLKYLPQEHPASR